jgi:hypothetical protein
MNSIIIMAHFHSVNLYTDLCRFKLFYPFRACMCFKKSFKVNKLIEGLSLIPRKALELAMGCQSVAMAR